MVRLQEKLVSHVNSRSLKPKIRGCLLDLTPFEFKIKDTLEILVKLSFKGLQKERFGDYVDLSTN